MVYQIGRLLRRIGDFEPMKSAPNTNQKAENWMSRHLQSTAHIRNPFRNGPFDKVSVEEMRELHDSLMETTNLFVKKHAEVERQSGVNARVGVNLVNNTQTISVPYYATLGFVDGAFSENGGSNVTACRLNSVRFGNNVTLLAWYSQIRYGVDKIVLYSTELAQQLYPFSFHCYYTVDEAQTLAQ